MDRATSRRLMLAAMAVALLARVAFGLLYWTDKPLTHDEREYLALAQSLRDGRGFTYPPGHDTGTAQQFGRAPGYPAFLALIGAPEEPRAAPARVKLVQAVLGAGVVWMIGWIASASGGARAGVIAAWIAAFYPPLVWLPAYVFSESLFMPLALGCVMALQRARAHTDARATTRAGGALTLAAGLLAGVATLVRPGMLLFLPLAVVWLLVRRQWSLALALVVAAAAVVAPWTLRNIREHGRVVLVASEGGVTFWTGNHPLARGEGDLAANPELKQAELAFRREHPGLSSEALEPLYYRDALEHIRRDPAWWIGLVARKAFYTVVPVGPSYALHSTKYLMASVVSYGLVAPFGLLGMARLVRRGSPAAPLLLLAGSVVLTGLIFFPQERFRIPVLDPTLIVCAAVVLASLVKRR